MAGRLLRLWSGWWGVIILPAAVEAFTLAASTGTWRKRVETAFFGEGEDDAWDDSGRTSLLARAREVPVRVFLQREQFLVVW